MSELLDPFQLFREVKKPIRQTRSLTDFRVRHKLQFGSVSNYLNDSRRASDAPVKAIGYARLPTVPQTDCLECRSRSGDFNRHLLDDAMWPLPHNTSCEYALLGSVLMPFKKILEAAEKILHPEHFYDHLAYDCAREIRETATRRELMALCQQMYDACCKAVDTLGDHESALMRLPQDNTKTYGEAGLITWDAKPGLIGLPSRLQPSGRAIASFENSEKGGYLRKTPLSCVITDQCSYNIVLPLFGGKDVAREKLDKKPLARVRDKLRLDAAFNRIGKNAYDAVDLDPARDMGNYELAHQWCADDLAKGLTGDEIERLVMFVVRKVSTSEKTKGNGIRFGYFSRAMTQKIARGDVPEEPKMLDQRRDECVREEAMADYNQRRACGEMHPRRPELSDFVTRVAA